MEHLSLPKKKEMYGITVKKVPIGKYLEIGGLLKESKTEIIEKLFPTGNFDNEIDGLINLDRNSLINLFSRILEVAPNLIIDLLSNLLDVQKETLLNNDEIGPCELIEIVETFCVLNNLGKFQEKIKTYLEKYLMSITSKTL